MKRTLKVKRLYSDAVIPEYQSPGAACFDLHSLDAFDIEPHTQGIVRTGLSFEVPVGHVMLVYSRSGHGFKDRVSLSNCVGVIDSDYRGEVKVALRNDGHYWFSGAAGDRIAQAMLVAIPRVELHEIGELSMTERGSNGFGSTGK